MKIYFAHSKELVNYKEIYTKLGGLKEHEFIFPYIDSDTPINSKETIKSVDLVIAEVSLPSTGLGIELGWAESFSKPIICIFKAESKPSRSLKHITDKLISYSVIDDLVSSISGAVSV
jgi:hypothetical protein